MGYYKEQYVSPKNFKKQIQPIATAIIPLQQKYKAMEEQLKTPKVFTHNPNAKPVYRHEKLNSLLKPENYDIYVQGNSYVIRPKDSNENSLELAYAVYRNFLMSDFVKAMKDVFEAQREYYDFKADKSHPKKAELLSISLAAEKKAKDMIKNLQTYVQKELF